MSDNLATYLHDHLAGSVAGLELVEALAEQHEGEALGRFAGRLSKEIEADRRTLKDLAERIGPGGNPLKDAGAWLAEKVSRLKLSRPAAGELGTFEALEALALGILGKKALWDALAVVAPQDPRLGEQDFGELSRRARAQHAQVEEQRLNAARTALRPALE
jgi:hypothetical protein